MFYMFYSGAGCCGKGCSYSLGVARSKNLLGPWEKNPNNPILTPNAEWKCPGHGSIVNDDKGRYWLLYHAYSVKDSIYPGRQGLLDEVIFGEDGWPTINAGMGPSSMAPAPIAPQLPRPAEFVDEFTEDKLGIGWQWLVAYDMPPVTIDPMNGGRLVVPASPPVIGKNAGTIVARGSRVGDYEATTEVTPDAGVSAGLAAVGDGDNALGISVIDGKAIVWRLGNGMSQQLAEDTAAATMALQMKATQGHLYSFSVSEDQGKTWKTVGEQVDSASVEPDLPPWDRAVRIGLVATGGAGTSAKFEYLRINAPVANPPATN
jgi:beta-xylosidase